ncbi:28525_t:CDS:2, partial [Racocetra persica]
ENRFFSVLKLQDYRFTQFCTYYNSWIHHYNLTWFVSDLIAGITIGLVVIPQSMGYAKIATLPVEYGLYSSFVGVSIYCFFATSKDISIGPTAVMSLLMGQTIDSILKINNNYANTTIAATFSLLTGFVALTLGLLRLGFIVANLLGISGIDNKEATYLVLIKTFVKYSCSFLSRRYPNKERLFFFLGISRNFVVVALCTFVAYLLNIGQTTSPINILKNVPSGFDHIGTPNLEPDLVRLVCGYLPGISVVLILEHVALARSFGRINDYKIVASQELIAIGATNALGSFFGAYPATGSFSRSAINAKSGVRTPLAGLYSEIASSNGDGSKQFTYVPLCPLFQTAQSPPNGVLIFRFDESLTYPNSSYIEDQIVHHVKSNTRRVNKIAEKVGDRPWNDASGNYENKALENSKLPKLKAIVFDFSAVSTIDTTGVQALVDIKKNLNRYTGDIIEYHFANILNEKIQRALIVAGFGGTEQPKLVIDVGIHSTEESSDENSELTPTEIDMPNETIVNTVRKKYLHLSLQEAVTAATNGVW